MIGLLVLAIILVFYVFLFKVIDINRFHRQYIINLTPAQTMTLLKDNIRQMSITIKALLWITGIIYPTDKRWAGEVDEGVGVCQIVRLPRWYDINPFSVKFRCQISELDFWRTQIDISPILTKSGMVWRYFWINFLVVSMEIIKMEIGDIFGDFLPMAIIGGAMSFIQMLLLLLFPLAFYIEMKISQKYFQKMLEP